MRIWSAFTALIVSVAASAADFPSVRGFGSHYVFAGGDLVQTARLMGPTGTVGWVHGREFLVHEVEKGSPADGILRAGDAVLKANGQGFGADARMGLGHAITESEAGDGKLRLTVYRDGKEQQAVVELQKLGTGDVYVNRGFRFCTAAIAMRYALPTGVERLGVMGAPESVFAAGTRSPAIAKARGLFFQRNWDAMAKALKAETLVGDNARYARQLLDAADAAQRHRSPHRQGGR